MNFSNINKLQFKRLYNCLDKLELVNTSHFTKQRQTTEIRVCSLMLERRENMNHKSRAGGYTPLLDLPHIKELLTPNFSCPKGLPAKLLNRSYDHEHVFWKLAFSLFVVLK